MTNEELKIREILLNGEEAVSPHVWEGVVKGLDKAAAPIVAGGAAGAAAKGRVFRFSWGTAALLAAAAAIAALVLILPGRNTNTPRQNAVAEVVETPVSVAGPAEVPADNTTEGIEAGQIASAALQAPVTAPKAPVTAPVTAPEAPEAPEAPAASEAPVAAAVTPDESPATTPAEEAPATTPAEEAPADEAPAAPASEYRPDPFAILIAQLEKPELRKPAAITVGGFTQAGGGMSSQMAAAPVHAAPTVPTTGIREAGEESFLLPVSLGVGFRFPIVPRVSIGAGLNYTMLGRTFTGTYTEAENGIIKRQISGASITEMQHYVGVPVNVYYDVVSGDKFSASIFGGGTIERALAHNYRIPYSEGVVNYSGKPSGLQPSVAAGIGLQYNIVPSFGLYAEPSVRYYFDAHQPRSIRTMQPWMITLEAGLRYNFKQ